MCPAIISRFEDSEELINTLFAVSHAVFTLGQTNRESEFIDLIEVLKRAIEIKSGEIQVYQQEVRDVLKLMLILAQENADSVKTAIAQKELISTLESDAGRLKSQVSQCLDNIRTSEEKNLLLSKTISEKHSQLELINEEVQSLRQERSTLDEKFQSTLKEHKDEVNLLKAQIESMRKKLSERSEAIEEQAKEISELKRWKAKTSDVLSGTVENLDHISEAVVLMKKKRKRKTNKPPQSADPESELEETPAKKKKRKPPILSPIPEEPPSSRENDKPLESSTEKDSSNRQPTPPPKMPKALARFNTLVFGMKNKIKKNDATKRL
eukprot:TRINITY_DN42596_c0_g1_i1.p1 TRINITY_DN42596_c0_g1~~TRINITY_DN42596_c0_g1_i1.p1  ORF type:complete len:324 (-),score=103.11 TRINITY_DN42596_c0_g1_i1:658-1629(-)